MEQEQADKIEVSKLDDMFKGWFIGNFEPTIHATNDVEVGIKKYKAGEYEGKHFHKIATEYTVIVTGKVRMSGIEYSDGDVLTIKPGVVTDFEALTDVTTVVVKLPGANNDKYVI
jgi:quercetin dioxygenase-like cupin family protein